MENATLKYTDTIIQKVRDTVVPGTEAPKIFETISKNPGIGLLCLDADGLCFKAASQSLIRTLS